MKKRFAVALSVIVIISVTAIVIFRERMWNTTDVPQASVESVSKNDYTDAYRKNELEPIRDDYYFQVVYPVDAEKFYKIVVKDKGYSKKLPIDTEIYFATDGENRLLSDSHFCIATMPASPRYSNIFAVLDNSEQGIVYLNLSVGLVGLYDRDGIYQSIPYEYHAIGRFDLTTLKTVQFNVK